jgi:hypothetical protein
VTGRHRTADRVMFAAVMAAGLGQAIWVALGTPLGWASQITWPLVAVAWVAVAWRYYERLNSRRD